MHIQRVVVPEPIDGWVSLNRAASRLHSSMS
jgi:hypothetical protein